MPAVECPIPGCGYVTAELDAAIVVELLKAHTTTHTTIQPAAKVEKVKRPTIAAAGTSEEWNYFQVRWNDYVTATKITGKDKVVQLLECCDEPLRKDLTRSAGSALTDKSEEEVMAAIKQLAVREENTMVARVALHNMRQDREETVRSFGARLRGQAAICKFVMKCPGCHICRLCNRTHHFESVCRSKDKPLNHNNDVPPSSAAVFDSLCSLSDSTDQFHMNESCVLNDSTIGWSVSIDHHVYDKLSNTWIQKQSKSQPFINVVARVSPQDYDALGFKLKQKHSTSVILPAMADTGCQSCLAGLNVEMGEVSRSSLTSRGRLLRLAGVA